MVYMSPCLCLYLQHSQGMFLICTILNEIPVLKRGLPQVQKQLFGHQPQFDEVARDRVPDWS